MAKKFKDGDQVIITGDHPWSDHRGTLVHYGPYGPERFGWKGWLVRINSGNECYVQPEQIRIAK